MASDQVFEMPAAMPASKQENRLSEMGDSSIPAASELESPAVSPNPQQGSFSPNPNVGLGVSGAGGRSSMEKR
jgi:hypothetical protein